MVPRRKLGKTGLSVLILGLGVGWTIEWTNLMKMSDILKHNPFKV